MKAHELLADQSKWTTGTRGRRANGQSVPANHPDAVCWCANGAIEKCYGDAWNQETFVGDDKIHSPAKQARLLCEARYPLPGTRQGMSLSEVNDRRGYEAVMEILRDADV